METLTDVDFTEPRFTSPILTLTEVSTLLRMSPDTVRSWAGQRGRPQLIHRVDQRGHRGWPNVPLVGLAEAASLHGLNTTLKSRKDARRAAMHIKRQFADVPFPLANQRLVTDGFTVFLEQEDHLFRLRDGQGAMLEVLRDHLKPLVFVGDDYPVAFNVPGLPGVRITPGINAGRMTFDRVGVPLFDVLGLLQAGEPEHVVASEFGLDGQEIELVKQHQDFIAQAA